MTKEQLLQFAEDFTSSMKEIMEKKNHDYSSDADPFANLSMCEQFGLASTEKGILIRITDKLSRLVQLLDKDAQVKDESFVDICIDAANYLILLAAKKTCGPSKIGITGGGLIEALKSRNLFHEALNHTPTSAKDLDTWANRLNDIASEELNKKTVED